MGYATAAFFFQLQTNYTTYERLARMFGLLLGKYSEYALLVFAACLLATLDETGLTFARTFGRLMATDATGNELTKVLPYPDRAAARTASVGAVAVVVTRRRQGCWSCRVESGLAPA